MVRLQGSGTGHKSANYTHLESEIIVPQASQYHRPALCVCWHLPESPYHLTSPDSCLISSVLNENFEFEYYSDVPAVMKHIHLCDSDVVHRNMTRPHD